MIFFYRGRYESSSSDEGIGTRALQYRIAAARDRKAARLGTKGGKNWRYTLHVTAANPDIHAERNGGTGTRSEDHLPTETTLDMDRNVGRKTRSNNFSGRRNISKVQKLGTTTSTKLQWRGCRNKLKAWNNRSRNFHWWRQRGGLWVKT